MREVKVHTPGKLMLGGEYAVLLPGGQGVCLAVGPGIDATFHRGGPPNSATLTLVGVSHSARFEQGMWQLDIPHPTPHFVLTALQQLLPHGHSVGFSLELSQAGWEEKREGGIKAGRGKVGLGGSAAATVATVASVCEGLELNFSARQRLDLARKSHHLAQGGKGSGIDVVCAGLGGVVHMTTATLPIHHLDWPEGWEILVGISPTPVSTPARIVEVERVLSQEPTFTREWLVRSNAAVEAVVLALHTQNSAHLVDALGQTGDVLRELGHICHLDMEDETLASMAKVAKPWGVARPSGAGGGDCGLAMASSPDQTEPLYMALKQAGVEILRVQPGPAGPFQGAQHG